MFALYNKLKYVCFAPLAVCGKGIDLSVTNQAGKISVMWNTPEDFGSSRWTYLISVNRTTQQKQIESTNSTSYEFDYLNPGTTYTVELHSISLDGNKTVFYCSRTVQLRKGNNSTLKKLSVI